MILTYSPSCWLIFFQGQFMPFVNCVAGIHSIYISIITPFSLDLFIRIPPPPNASDSTMELFGLYNATISTNIDKNDTESQKLATYTLVRWWTSKPSSGKHYDPRDAIIALQIQMITKCGLFSIKTFTKLITKINLKLGSSVTTLVYIILHPWQTTRCPWPFTATDYQNAVSP